MNPVLFFDYFLPRICPSCNNVLNKLEDTVCSQCLSKILTADEERLIYEFNKKFKKNNIISGFTSLYVFEPEKELQKVIHQLKYNLNFKIGHFLGEKLSNKLKPLVANWNIDLIVPVPLHHLKQVERGYNQSTHIAKGITGSLDLKYDHKILKRIIYTDSQTKMNVREREENMRGAFKLIKKRTIEGKNILLIDDVITTGATISECGSTLINGGAAKIFAASAAIAR